MQQEISSTMDRLKGVNGILHWCTYTYWLYVSFVDSEFYDDFMAVHKYDSEAPLVYSTPVTLVWLIPVIS